MDIAVCKSHGDIDIDDCPYCDIKQLIAQARKDDAEVERLRAANERAVDELAALKSLAAQERDARVQAERERAAALATVRAHSPWRVKEDGDLAAQALDAWKEWLSEGHNPMQNTGQCYPECHKCKVEREIERLIGGGDD